mmetsp:Transcript_17338/g.33884  ORF Transcript_17338/g.33884 Transcript_17338/m.33884 type:complete len:86 (-) Transcript_17338:263-520(-)
MCSGSLLKCFRQLSAKFHVGSKGCCCLEKAETPKQAFTVFAVDTQFQVRCIVQYDACPRCRFASSTVCRKAEDDRQTCAMRSIVL